MQNSKTKDWLNVIGDTEYYKANDCTVFRPTQGRDLVPIFISIGHTKKGVNYVNLVFAPSYDKEDPDNELDMKLGITSTEMEFTNLAFS